MNRDHEYINYNTFPYAVVKPSSMANMQHFVENPQVHRQTPGLAQVQYPKRGLVPQGRNTGVQLITSQTRGKAISEKVLPMLEIQYPAYAQEMEIQDPAYAQVVNNQSQHYHPAFNHQVNNYFDPAPPAIMHQYQALAPRFLPVAMPDREAPFYSLPGSIPPRFAAQPGLIPPATMNQANVFQPIQGGQLAYSAPVIPTSSLQQQNGCFFPVSVAGSAHQYAQPQMQIRGDSFSQPIMQGMVLSSDGSSQESDDYKMNPLQRGSSANMLIDHRNGITKVNHEAMHPLQRGSIANMLIDHRNGITKVIRDRGYSFEVNDEMGDQRINELPHQHKRQSSLVRGLLDVVGREQQRVETGNARDVDQQSYAGSLYQTGPLRQNMKAQASFLAGNSSRKEWRYDSDRWATVSALCHALERICMNNRGKTTRAQVKTEFHAATVPAISLAAYLKRIAWFLQCSKECFVLALEYLHRLVKYKPEVVVNYNNVHNLIITCINVAAKFIEDRVCGNKFYARVVGVEVATVSAFEVRFLFLLGFDLNVMPAQYQTRYKAMLLDNQGPSKITIDPEGNP